MGAFKMDTNSKLNLTNLTAAKPFVGKDGYQNSLGTSSLDTGADIARPQTDEATITGDAREKEMDLPSELLTGLFSTYGSALLLP